MEARDVSDSLRPPPSQGRRCLPFPISDAWDREGGFPHASTYGTCYDEMLVKTGRISRAKRPCVTTKLLCYDLTSILVRCWRCPSAASRWRTLTAVSRTTADVVLGCKTVSVYQTRSDTWLSSVILIGRAYIELTLSFPLVDVRASESWTKTDYEPCRQCHPRVVLQLEWNGMKWRARSLVRPAPVPRRRARELELRHIIWHLLASLLWLLVLMIMIMILLTIIILRYWY